MIRIKGIQNCVDQSMLEVLRAGLAHYRSLWCDSERENRELKDKIKHLEQIITDQRVTNRGLHKTADRHAAVMRFMEEERRRYYRLAVDTEEKSDEEASVYYCHVEILGFVLDFEDKWRRDHDK